MEFLPALRCSSLKVSDANNFLFPSFSPQPVVMLDKLGAQGAGLVASSSAELQLKLTDNKSSLAAAGMESGAGKKLMDISGPALSKRKLLVALDLLCLLLGKYLKKKKNLQKY